MQRLSRCPGPKEATRAARSPQAAKARPVKVEKAADTLQKLLGAASKTLAGLAASDTSR